MKWNGSYTVAALWGATVPMWGATAAFNLASGHTGAAAFNLALVVLNAGLCAMNIYNGRQQNRIHALAEENARLNENEDRLNENMRNPLEAAQPDEPEPPGEEEPDNGPINGPVTGPENRPGL